MNGKVALVTGASSGIGAATARLLASQGARVGLVARSAEGLEALAGEIGDAALAAPADVSDSAAVESAIAAVESDLGPLDLAVNAAGIAEPALLQDLTDQNWHSMIEVNLSGTFFVGRQAGLRMRDRGQGAIVNLGSELSFLGLEMCGLLRRQGRRDRADQGARDGAGAGGAGERRLPWAGGHAHAGGRARSLPGSRGGHDRDHRARPAGAARQARGDRRGHPLRRHRAVRHRLQLRRGRRCDVHLETPSPGRPDDPALSELSELSVAVVADVLDRLGYSGQVMDAHIRPVHRPCAIAARASTIQAVESRERVDDPYVHELAAVDAIEPGSVVVVSTGRCYDAAVWGELLATRARHQGASGAIVDGGVRDTAALERMGFPVFAASVSARDSFGRLEVRTYQEPVVCGNVAVRRDDIVLADPDGVVVVPDEMAAEVAREATIKRRKEVLAQQDLASGVSAGDAYRRHGVL